VSLLQPPGVKEAHELATENQARPPIIDGPQAGFDPSADRVLVHTKESPDLVHGVAPVDLDAPRVQSLHRAEPI
jgi:hypothetical protein